MNINNLILVGLFVLCGGCTSLGKNYQDYDHKEAKETAKVTFIRTSGSKLYYFRSAPVYIDDQKCFSLPIGGFTSIFLEPGDYRFMTTTFDAPSECDINVKLNAGTEFFVEVRPNTSAAMKLMMTSFVNSAAHITGNSTSPGYYGAGKDCEGMFMFLPIRDNEVENKVKNLRHLDSKDQC